MAQLITGRILSFEHDPFLAGPTAAKIHDAVLVEGGKIVGLGSLAALKAHAPQAPLKSYGESLVMAGFVDAHVHFPQTAIIASWGKRLIDWLNDYTFPEEMRLNDPAYADMIAARYFSLALSHGTTSACSYATIHTQSVDAFFTQAHTLGLRAWAGKTCMDKNAPYGLRDTAQSAYDQSKALLQKWHGQARLSYVITPRFAPTSSPEQLSALGALWAEHPDCLMQTHLSEQPDEVAWVADLYPQARDYLDVYEHHGLLGRGALFGHAIHLTEREKARLVETGAALVHCPTSNSFIGSGLFDLVGLKSLGLRLGLATDTGGGSSFSMLRTMAAAYEISQLRGTALHPSELLWLATQGSARALSADHQIGNIALGLEADFVVLDLASTPAIAQASARASDIWSAVFPTIMMGDDRAVQDVWIAGKCLPK